MRTLLEELWTRDERCCAVTADAVRRLVRLLTMRAELIGHFQPWMAEIYLHIDARMADYIRTHP